MASNQTGASIKTLFALMILVLSMTVSGSASAQRRPAENDAADRKPADVTVAYGTHKHQYVDMRFPDQNRYGPGPYPVILVLHGGCWVRPYASASNIGVLADALRDEGYATLNIEYRTTDEAGGGWPGTFHDVAEVADKLNDWATIYPLDPKRIATTGHSAGGHLALWLAARESISARSPLYSETPHSILGAVILGGPGDLEFARPSWTEGCGIDTVTVLLGGEQLRAFNAASGSPARLLPFSAQQIFITGSEDRIVPPHVGEAYIAKTQEVDVSARHIIIEGVGHHDYLNPEDTRTWPIIVEAFAEIFAQTQDTR